MKEGWTYKKLGEICDFRSGFAFKSNKFTKIGEPIIRISDIQNEKIDDSNLVFFDPKSYSEDLSKYLVFPDDILIAMSGGTTGKLGINTSKKTYYLNQRVGVFRENKKYLNHRYLYYFLHTKSEESLRIAAGAAQPNLSTVQIKSFVIPIPPLSEQQSIVDYLDSAFAKIEAMKVNAEKALNEAKALFQASLKEMLEPKEGWEEKSLGDVCEIIRGKRFVRADIVEEGVPCIHYGDIYTHYGLSVTKTRGFIKPELAKKLRFAKKNDVVVVQAGENNWDIGVGIAYLGEEPAAVHDACFILKHKQNPMYISYYLRSYNYHWYLIDHVHEGKICSFLKPALENAPFPLPPLSEQKAIVETLDSLKSKVDRLQENFDKISQECDSLKQAILRQVFE